MVGLTDSYDSKKVYFISSLIGAIGLILFAFCADGFYTALLLWSIVGAGFDGTYMPGLQILNERLDSKGKEKYVSVYTAFFGLGTAASFFLLGILKEYNLDWANDIDSQTFEYFLPNTKLRIKQFELHQHKSFLHTDKLTSIRSDYQMTALASDALDYVLLNAQDHLQLKMLFHIVQIPTRDIKSSIQLQKNLIVVFWLL